MHERNNRNETNRVKIIIINQIIASSWVTCQANLTDVRLSLHVN